MELTDDDYCYMNAAEQKKSANLRCGSFSYSNGTTTHSAGSEEELHTSRTLKLR
jgi:hypothetical protein